MKVYRVYGRKELGYFSSMKKAMEAIKEQIKGHEEYAGFYYKKALSFEKTWCYGEENMEKVLRAGGEWGWMTPNCYLRDSFYVRAIEVK